MGLLDDFERDLGAMLEERDNLCSIIESLEAEVARLRGANQRLATENAELWAGRGRWPEKADDFPCCTSTTPRTITADELREGQLICIHRGHSWGLRAIGIFVNLEGDLVTIKAGGGRTFTESVQFHTIVLLEDAPEPEQRGESIGIRDVRKGDVLDGYYWDITPGGVTLKNAVCTREVEGRTSFIEVEQSGETHQIGFSSSDVELRLVHRPDRSPVTAEAIRASEPGSTWEESDGDVWEWTGRDLRHHSECPCEDCEREGLGAVHEPETALANYGPFARSTATPRGDYGTPPRLTVHKLNVAPEGSLLRHVNGAVVSKHADGQWIAHPDHPGVTSEHLIEYGWADATLHLPEAA